MKHGQEKSDLLIVALKPANNPGQLGAELVEPRERTEGNTGEQHTRRTLRRVSVSQRLDRVRGAACELLRYLPKVGARCVNHARRDLCGGHPAMDVPTAIGTRYNFVRFVRSGHLSSGIGHPFSGTRSICVRAPDNAA